MNRVESLCAGAYPAQVRLQIILVAALLGVAASANAASPRIIKVLPHYLDDRGRHMLNPSLYDRDAYQEELRANPEKRAALRFDVHWKARRDDTLTLRVEARGVASRQPATVVLDRKVEAGWFRTWTPVLVSGDDYKRLGDLTAWRVTLWRGTNQVAEQKSFLW